MTDEKKETKRPLADPAVVEHGGRVELRLLDAGTKEGTVLYDARWFTSDQEMSGQVSVATHDRPEVSVDGPADLPDWLEAFTATLVRTTARSAQKDQVWPRRLTRWRSVPTPKNRSSPPAGGSNDSEGE